MIMSGMKDGSLAVVFVLFFSTFVSDTAGLFITQESATKLQNETFFVLCRDEAGRSVTWRGPKGPLGLKTRPSVQTVAYGISLLFNQTIPEDAGIYTCSVGTEKKEFTLTIADPLMFMDTSTEQTGVEGRDVTLRCEVKGGKIAWSVEEGDITDKKFVIMGDGLLIKDVQRSDSKTYICKAVQQTTGNTDDRKIKLRVLHGPYSPDPNEIKVYGYINGTANLTCWMVADPPATFQWIKSEEKNSKGLEKIGRVINVTNNVSVMQLFVDKAAFGKYKCIGSNRFSKLEKQFILAQGSKPHPPKVVQLKDPKGDSLGLNIQGPDPKEVEIPPGMETNGFEVQYKKMEEDKWKIQYFNLSSDQSYTLKGLNSKTEYAVKVATRNPAGLSDFTEISAFKTSSSVNPSLPSSFSVATSLAAILLINYVLAAW